MTYQELEETQSYILNDGNSETIYEMICRQELVKKELLESKKEFDVIWATNPSIQKLASCIFESDEKIIDALSEAIKEVPYVALASKNNLFKVFSSSLSDIDGIGVSEKDIQKYASKIFEAKKEVKEFMINTLNEKFGVNVQNLQDPPSFKSLINTQVVIFETISRLSPNGSIIKKTLSELSEVLKQKSGVEAIDINNLIYEMFIRAGYGQILDENRMLSKYAQVDFRRIAKDLSDISTVINGMKDKLMSDQGQEDVGYESDENIEPEMPEEEMPEEEMPEEEMPPEGMQQPEMEPEMPPEGMQQPEMEPEGMEQPEMEPEQIKSREQMMDDLNNLEQMIKDLADELNISDEKTSGPEEEEVD
jgi:hypothetical protein